MIRSPFHDLSLRIKIPLRAVFLVLVTATVLSGALLVREYRQMRGDTLNGAERWTEVLGKTLEAPVRHDDLWRAFEIIRAAVGDATTPDLATRISVVDPERRIYVTTDPDRYPILSPLHEAGTAGQELDAELQRRERLSRTLELGEQLFVLAPIEADGVLLGHLVLEYSTSIFAERFVGMWRSATILTLLVLAVILPVSAYWGRRTAEPLLQLADCMGRIGQRIPENDECVLYTSHDEIGQLGEAMRRLLVELREKQELEDQILFAERLAAVGRLAGSIAHEINNPLGGMLNAIDTYRRHGSADPSLSEKTFSLLERGLRQIRDTVSALLVEAKAPSHPLAPEDLEDVRVLLEPDLTTRGAQLDWHAHLPGTVNLPATLVRQILINLILNAAQAVERGGRIECAIAVEAHWLAIRVANDGAHIAPERIPYLFEPFVAKGRVGHALGLWITYQIVRDLEGDIRVRSDPGWTCFDIKLPLPAPAFPESPT